jgi:hypothetical protein
MKYSTLIKVIDLFSFAALTLMVSTAILIEYTLPPRSGGNEVLSLTRHEWGNVHFYFSIIFLFLMSAHLITHLKFIKAVIIGKASTESNYRIAVGIIGVIALIFLAFAPVISPVTDVNRGQHYNYQHR